jgi:hypothetical protein
MIIPSLKAPFARVNQGSLDDFIQQGISIVHHAIKNHVSYIYLAYMFVEARA